MKTASILILLAFAIAVIIPNVTILDVTNNNQPAILTLDVCSPLNSATTANADMPSLYECMYSLTPLASTSFYTTVNSVFNPLIIAFQEDRPPRA